MAEIKKIHVALNVKYIKRIEKRTVHNRVLNGVKTTLYYIYIVHDNDTLEYLSNDNTVIDKAYNIFVNALNMGLNMIQFQVVSDDNNYLTYPIFD